MRFIVTLFGLLSFLGGILIALPDKKNTLRPVQIGLNELSWLPGIMGIIAVIGGLQSKRRSWLAILGGGIGAALALRPFLDHAATVEDMAGAMRAGLGRDYERKIPFPMRLRMADSVWSLENALGQRERTAQARLWRDVPFTSKLKLDVYQPLVRPAVGDKYPIVIVIHGGSWRSGDKQDWFVPHNRYIAGQGYVVFSIEYRLSDEALWPAQLEDVQTAIQWVKDHADQYGADASRIALMGRSAGGHLALMAAYCGDEATPIKAVISIYGPVEMRWPEYEDDSSIVALLGGLPQDKPREYDSATPLNFVRDGLPPTLVIEGGTDVIVPHHHGDKLANAMSMTDTKFVLLRAPWARHGFDAVLSGLGGQLVQYHIDRFLAWSLYGEGA
jgi:acetyl esterase/lipase